jgi:SAM-dependent methyltransferase
VAGQALAVSCILCDADEFRERYQIAGYPIRSCTRCGLTQVHPLPPTDVLAALYDDDYFEGAGSDTGYRSYADQEAEYLATFDEDVRRIREFAPRGRLLEIGCGYGYFLRRAQAAGFEVHGLDTSARAVRVCESHLPGRVFEGGLESAKALEGLRFDVIFASHLLEHLTDPRAFVAGLADRLAPGGVVALVTPDITSLLSRISGPRWVSFKLPEHVAYWAPKTITRLLEGAGLAVVAIDPAYQHHRVPFLMSRVRELIHPLGRLVPRFEDLAMIRPRMLRVTSGSFRAIARLG